MKKIIIIIIIVLLAVVLAYTLIHYFAFKNYNNIFPDKKWEIFPMCFRLDGLECSKNVNCRVIFF